MSKKISCSLITTAAIALLVGVPVSTHAQSVEGQQQGHEHMQGQMQGGDAGVGAESPACCQQMAEKKQAMHAKQAEAQAELDQLVAVVNSTVGETQQAAIAALLTKLVEQRGQMNGMMQMHPEMMEGMMSGGMSDCPMMKKMEAKMGAEETPADDDAHSQHH